MSSTVNMGKCDEDETLTSDVKMRGSELSSVSSNLFQTVGELIRGCQGQMSQ